MNLYLKMFLLGLITVGTLVACGQDTKDITLKEDTNEQTETDQSEEATNSEETKEESTKQEEKSKLGSRTNPVPFQTTATVDDVLYSDSGETYAIKFDLTVVEVIRGDQAYQSLVAMNEYNEPAPEGYEWILTKTKVKFLESETEDLSFFIDGIMNFDVVSENGDIYAGDIYGTTDPDFSFEMYVGNEKEGYIANLVKVGEKAQLRYEGLLDGHVFFNLQ